jgi:serine/threonine protein kinase/WD40 repeat protein
LIGKTLAHYEIIDLLGEGGMGQVYRARDRNLDRDVAVKIIPPSFAEDPERLLRFEREAKILASLNHPGIATVFGLHEDDGIRFLAMELVPGLDLAHRMESGPLPVSETLDIARQLADAIEATHLQRVVHRDIKPSNIMVTPEGKATVLDFGLARSGGPVSGSGSSQLSQSPTMITQATMEGVLLGTAAYMSPEQARGRPVDARSDVWAFGCVLFEMLSGKPLFAGETMSDTIARILEREPNWTELPNETPAHLRRLLDRCLDKNVHTRLQAVGEARIALVIGDDHSEAERASPGAKSLRWLPWLLVPLVAFATWFLKPTVLSPGHEQSVYSFSIPQPFGGWSPPRISPDGRHLAYLEASGIWIRSLGDIESRALNGTDKAAHLFWAPDSRTVAFVAGNELKRITIAGTTPAETVCRLPEGLVTGSWAPDGTILLEVTETGGNEGWYVLHPGADSLDVIRTFSQNRATTPDKAGPFFLPDSRHFLVTLPSEGAAFAHVGSIDSEELTKLVRADSWVQYAAGHLFYVLEGKLLAHPFDPNTLHTTDSPLPVEDVYVFTPTGGASFSVSGNGTIVYRPPFPDLTPLWYDRQGRFISPALEPGPYQSIRLSPDGTQAVVALRDARTGSGDLWLVDLERGVPMQLTDHPRGEMVPVWSPDGTRIAFSGDWTGPPNIYVMDVSGGEPRVVVPADRLVQFAGSWTPDGHAIAYSHDSSSGTSDLWLVDVESGERKNLLASDGSNFRPRISPDGLAVGYTRRGSARGDVFVRSFPEMANPVRVSTDGAVDFRWGPSNGELFYWTLDNRLMVVTVTPRPGGGFTVGPENKVLEVEAFLGWDVAPDGRILVGVTDAEARLPADRVIVGWPNLISKASQ